MHEVSIAEGILDIAEARAREAGATEIRVIGIRLGEFTTVVQEALQFAFEVAREGTLAAGARLEIEYVPTIVRCVVCGDEPRRMKELRLFCNVCGFPLEIVAGEEMQVQFIDIDTAGEST